MVPLHEFIELPEEERDGLYPFIWTVDHKKQLGRVLMSAELVASVIERRDYWRMLKSIVGMDQRAADVDAIAKQARIELAQKLLALAGGESIAMPLNGSGHSHQAVNAGNGINGSTWEYEPAWIETPECTACDECTKINGDIFAYNDQGKAVVINPKGGPFKDLVKAAEKCTAGCIHPGTPFNPGEPDVQKLMKRAEKYH
jgi:pyruvate-ferredoxin/flavodoxin oxidoreductase